MFERIAAKLVESETISAEDKELYEYGLKQAANTALNIATTLVVGFIFGMVWQSVLFMAAYIPLRSYAGGYHAGTPLKCYIFSVVLTVCAISGIRFIPDSNILIGALAFAASAVIFAAAPLGDKNKPLDEIEVKVFKRRTRIILFTEIISAGIFMFAGLAWISVCVVVSMTVAGIMLAVGVVKNKLS